MNKQILVEIKYALENIQMQTERLNYRTPSVFKVLSSINDAQLG